MVGKKKTSRRRRGVSARRFNGLAAFSMHKGSGERGPQFDALTAAVGYGPAAVAAAAPGVSGVAPGPAGVISALDSETVARGYLNEALASEALPEITAPVVDGSTSEFRSLGTESLPLTGTTTVKFRQQLNKIPVYGSLVTVELGETNQLLAINTAMGMPKGVSRVAKVSPAEAVAVVSKRAGLKPTDITSTPRLYYYFDQEHSKWRLVYILEDVVVRGAKKTLADGSGKIRPAAFDYIVDAHKATLVAQLPRTPSAGVQVQAPDAAQENRTFEVSVGTGQQHVLRNPTLNVHTHDFNFRDVRFQFAALPGAMIANPPPWRPAGVSAHANAEDVVRFLREVLFRNNIDNNGGPIVSSINCLYFGESNGQEWLNAVWFRGQMMYGQRVDATGALHTLARNLDIVGHEIFHGVTDFTARLEYANQSGALNESISDIFGVIISNAAEPDIGRWNWQVGEGLTRTGAPFRDMSDPEQFDQPAHMDDYVNLPNTEAGDHGGVHVNSGIHNHAMFKLTTTRDENGFLFTSAQVAALYYIALTQYLSRTSGFSDCRRGVLLAAGTLFRNDPLARKQLKLDATAAAYDAVGIT